MTDPETELKAELLAELRAELQDSKGQQPENQVNDDLEKGPGTNTSSQTSGSDDVKDGDNETPDNEGNGSNVRKPWGKEVTDPVIGPENENEAEKAKENSAQIDKPENDEPAASGPEKKQVVVATPEATEDTAEFSETSPRKSIVQIPQPKIAESPASTAPTVATIESQSTTSSSESDHGPKDADDPLNKEDDATMPKAADSVESPKSSRMGSLFSPVISKLRMDSIVTPTSNKSRRSTISSSPSTIRKTSQALSDLLPLSAITSRPKMEEERLSIVTGQTPTAQTPKVKVVELVRVPSSTTVIDFVPDSTKEPERQQKLSVATIGQNSAKNEPWSRVPSISSQTLAPSVTLETDTEPIILKKINTDQTSRPSTTITPSNPIIDAVKSLREPRKRDRLRNRACPEWLLNLLFGHTAGKRMKAMLELAAGH